MYSFKDKPQIPLIATVNTQYQRAVVLMHCKADVQTQTIYHPTCICTCDQLQVEHKPWVGMWLRKAAVGSGWASPFLTSQDETGHSTLSLHMGWALLSPCQPYKGSVPVHGFGIGPLDHEQASPRKVTAPKTLFPNISLLCFTY